MSYGGNPVEVGPGTAERWAEVNNTNGSTYSRFSFFSPLLFWDGKSTYTYMYIYKNVCKKAEGIGQVGVVLLKRFE